MKNNKIKIDTILRDNDTSTEAQTAENLIHTSTHLDHTPYIHKVGKR